MKKLVIMLALALTMGSCADSKDFEIDGKNVTVEPYGWFDTTQENDSIKYKVNVGNIIWSAIFSETIVVPVLLTGTELYEPVSKKKVNKNN
jgi:hypothetical protein